MTTVYVEKVTASSGLDLASHTKTLLEHFNLKKIFSGKERVLIKPNFSGEFGSTDPYVVKGIVDALKPLGLDIVVGESTIIGHDTEAVFQKLKVRDILDVEVVDFKGKPTKRVEISGKLLDDVVVTEEVSESDGLISAAKLKTLNATTASLCMKNLKGLLPDEEKLRFHHLGVSQAVVDLYSRFTPDLNVIDAVTGYDMGTPVQVNRLIAGKDAVATDIVGTRMMGIDPFSINKGYPSYSHIGKAVDQHLGDKTPDIAGDFCIVPFKGPPRSLKDIVIPESVTVIDGNPCSACIGILNLAFSRMSNPSPVTVCVGPAITREIEGAVYMGNCCSAFSCSGTHAVGCPPHSRLDLKPALERMEVNEC